MPAAEVSQLPIGSSVEVTNPPVLPSSTQKLPTLEASLRMRSGATRKLAGFPGPASSIWIMQLPVVKYYFSVSEKTAFFVRWDGKPYLIAAPPVNDRGRIDHR